MSKNASKLNSFKANILRSSAMTQIEWEKKDDTWKGGVKAPTTRLAMPS